MVTNAVDSAVVRTAVVIIAMRFWSDTPIDALRGE